MSFSAGLYRDFARKGGLIFNKRPATRSSDYKTRTDYWVRMRRKTYHGSYVARP